MPHKFPTLAPTLLIFERRRGGKGGAFSFSGDGLGKEAVEVKRGALLFTEYTLAEDTEGACVDAGSSSSQMRSMTPARMNAQSEHVVRRRVKHQPEPQRG